MINLDDDQEAAVQMMVDSPTRAALNASQYGTGKTVVTVEVARRLGGAVNLIICPIFTKRSWRSTILGQVPDADVRMIDSTKAGRENFEALLTAEPGWYIVGREYFRTKQKLINPMSKRINFAAYDECQAWANHRGVGFSLMKQFHPQYKMALSATPARNKFQGMFAIHQWLWPKMEGHRSFWTWVEDWCETEDDYFGGTVVVGEKNPGEFVKALPCYVRLEMDLGEPHEFEILVELSPTERRIYDQINKRMVVFLQEHPLIIKLPAIKRMRLRQVTLGEITYDKETDTVLFDKNMKSTKYEALLQLMEEFRDEPMLIFAASQKYVHALAERMQDEGFRAFEWSGQVTETQREQIKQWFIDGEIDYIVATPASIGEGTDGLQTRCRFMVWMERSDDGMHNEQAFRRVFRRGQTRQVVSVSILAEDTYDQGQLDKLVAQQLAMNESLRKGE
jgi:hypothetical protein